MDTMSNPADWRRKSYEVCYETNIKGLRLWRVCLACSRECIADQSLRPVIRYRRPEDVCDCRTQNPGCVAQWSAIREKFDQIACETHRRDGGDSRTIAPRQIRPLLKRLRAPYPVESNEVDDALLALAEGREDETFPRILPVPFEKFYRKYYDENTHAEADADL
jgi:hypothetical protein